MFDKWNVRSSCLKCFFQWIMFLLLLNVAEEYKCVKSSLFLYCVLRDSSFIRNFDTFDEMYYFHIRLEL